MNDRLSPEDWRRERALAALARAMRGEDEDRPKGSLLSMASPVAAVKMAAEEDDDWRRMAAERHRLARLRREAGRSEPEFSLPEPEPELEPEPEDLLRSRYEEAAFPEPSAETVVPQPPVRESPAVEPAAADRAVAGEPDRKKPSEDPLRRVGIKAGVFRSKPAIYRLTLLGAVLGVAGAVLLWKRYGALMAFLPLVGVLAGLAAGLLLATMRGLQRRKAPLGVQPAPSEPAKNGDSPRFAEMEPRRSVDGTRFSSGKAASAAAQTPSVEEIRASLRQFRAATQDLARRRDRR